VMRQMKQDIDKTLALFPSVRHMLEAIPQDLWDIFLPETDSDLAMLEADVIAQQKRDLERSKVMAVQKLCGFPLRPNEPLLEVIARAKIKGMKNSPLSGDATGDTQDAQ